MSCYNVIKIMVCTMVQGKNIAFPKIWTNIRALSATSNQMRMSYKLRETKHKVNTINTGLFNHFVHAHSMWIHFRWIVLMVKGRHEIIEVPSTKINNVNNFQENHCDRIVIHNSSTWVNGHKKSATKRQTDDNGGSFK